GPNSAELIIVARTEEREWCSERSRTHARDDLELRSITALRPAHQQARTERTIRPAARERENIDLTSARVLASVRTCEPRYGWEALPQRSGNVRGGFVSPRTDAFEIDWCRARCKLSIGDWQPRI